jgi:hypothetical protein
MLWTRVYQFKTKEDLVGAIRGLDPHVRVCRFKNLTLVVTEDEPDKPALDELYKRFGAEPVGEWRDRWR